MDRSTLLVARSLKLSMQGDPSCTANKSAIVYGCYMSSHSAGTTQIPEYSAVQENPG